MFGDKGFVGTDYITTPVRKPEHRELYIREKEYNAEVSSHRSPVERAVAQLKTWRILFTDYRRPLETFLDSFRAAIGLYFEGYSATLNLATNRLKQEKDDLSLERIGLPHSFHPKQAVDMYHTTGLTKAQITDLRDRIAAHGLKPGMRPWPPILGLRDSPSATLKYLRRNRTQAEIAEDYGVSQPTISRAIAAMTPLTVGALAKFVPTADSLRDGRQYAIDGTLFPCWSWRSRRDLYSGKHKTAGMAALVACTLEGRLSWISGPVPGSRHDSFITKDSSVLGGVNPMDYIGDKGFAGHDMITPFKKPAGSELLDWQKEFNSGVNKIRWVIEQAIAHVKTWRILHTDYRGPIDAFPEVITAVISLEFFRAF